MYKVLNEDNLHHLYVVVQYTNWKDEVRDRLVRPLEGYFNYKSSFHHPDKQWVLHVFDYWKNDYRIFSMKNISSWRPAIEEDFKLEYKG